MSLSLEEEADILFQNSTVSEIQSAEKSIRGDVEKKKEELRQLVGERYRDLIEAADTILQMHESAVKVDRNFGSLCKELLKADAAFDSFPTHSKESKESKYSKIGLPYLLNRVEYENNGDNDDFEESTIESQFYGVATQMKLLVDTQEHVWNAIENNELLKAVQLYSLAETITRSLQTDVTVSSALFDYFPILSTQWASISSSKLDIIQICKTLIENEVENVEKLCEYLVSLAIIDKLTTTQILHTLLDSRILSLRNLFKSVDTECTNDIPKSTTNKDKLPSSSSTSSTARTTTATTTVASTTSTTPTISSLRSLSLSSSSSSHSLILESCKLVLSTITDINFLFVDGHPISSSLSSSSPPSSASSLASRSFSFSTSTPSPVSGVSSTTGLSNVDSKIAFASASLSTEDKGLLYKSLSIVCCDQPGTEIMVSDHSAVSDSDISHSTISKLYGYNSGTLTLLRHLPPPLHKFQPYLDVNLRTVISPLTITNTCDLWINNCAKEIDQLIPSVLEGVSSCQELSSIENDLDDLLRNWGRHGYIPHSNLGLKAHRKSSVLDAIKDEEFKESQESELSSAFTHVLGHNVDIWTLFYRRHLLHQISVIIENKFTLVMPKIVENLEQILDKEDNVYDSHLGRYCCKEEKSDIEVKGKILFNKDNLFSKKINFDSFSTLSLKSMGITPSVHQICCLFDTLVLEIIDDIQFVLENPKREKVGFESNEILTFLRQSCVRCIEFIQKEFHKLIESSKSPSNMMLIGRVCHCFANYSVQLKECFRVDAAPSKIPEARKKFLLLKGRRFSTDSEYHPLLIDIRKLLMDTYKTTIDKWSKVLSDSIDKKLNQFFPIYRTKRYTHLWESINIMEEDENGKPVRSQISLPSHCSPVIFDILNTICNSIQENIGFVNDIEAIQKVVCTIGQLFVDKFETLIVRRDIPQIGALQMFVDFTFATEVLSSRGSRSNEYFSKVDHNVSSILEMIDPFDLNVFRPFLEKKICLLLLHTESIFKVLDVNLDKKSRNTKYYVQSEQDLEISSASSRFSDDEDDDDDDIDNDSYLENKKSKKENKSIVMVSKSVPTFAYLHLPAKIKEDYETKMKSRSSIEPFQEKYVHFNTSPGRRKNSESKRHEDGYSMIGEKGKEMVGKLGQNLPLMNGSESLKYLLFGGPE